MVKVNKSYCHVTQGGGGGGVGEMTQNVTMGEGGGPGGLKSAEKVSRII
jgi:hypothetical protein